MRSSSGIAPLRFDAGGECLSGTFEMSGEVRQCWRRIWLELVRD